MQYRIAKRIGLTIASLSIAANVAIGQATTPKPPTPRREALVVEPAGRQSSQIVTVVHRLTGIKALALLQRSGEAISMADDDIVSSSNAVTSIIAGYALGDGQTVVARLPQAEAEVEALTLFSSTPLPRRPNAPMAVAAQRAGVATTTPMAMMPLGSAGFVVVQSSGQQSNARYVGLDSESGLSLLKINGLNVTGSRDADEARLATGQAVRLFAPIRVFNEPTAIQTMISMRVGEFEGKIAEITRTPAGRVTRITIKAPSLSSAIVGGIALNEAGEAVGIVETSNGGIARLIPAASVRRAAERVLRRQSNVPRPWLGVRGEAVATSPFEKFYVSGWTASEAAMLKGQYGGILLTSVAPGTPAAFADLRAGDVIVRVNDFEVKNAEDFSYVLNEVGSGATANFTVFRGQPATAPTAATSPPRVTTPPAPSTAVRMAPDAFKFRSFVVPVKLSEALNPAGAMRLAENYAFAFPNSDTMPPFARGLETVTLSGKAATYLGARGGLLVVFVDPESAAARSGLRVFDVIETVDGRLVGRASWPAAIQAGDSKQLTLGVVRDHQKLEVKLEQKDEHKR